MKKKIFAAILAVLTAAFMAACGNGSSSENDVPDVTTSAETETETNTETDVTETETETETNTETDMTETNTETEAEDNNSQAAAAGNTYSGNGYTMTINSEKWVDGSEYVKLISEYSSELDMSLDVSAEDIENLNDGMFFHADLSGSNFNIVCSEIGDLGSDFDISQFGDLMEEQYTAAGFTYLGDEVFERNGKNWLKIEVEADQMGTAMRMLQYMALNGVNQYVVTYTSDKDIYDEALSDFEEVFNTFEFTE